MRKPAVAVSPVAAVAVQASLAGFMVVYAIVFSAGVLYIGRLLVLGPQPSEPEPDGHPMPVRRVLVTSTEQGA